MEKSVISWVYCTKRGYLIVQDVAGKRVDELCGQINYEKYEEIENRSMEGITTFRGLEHLRCVVCELKKKPTDE
jgi:hypothetical protein